MRREIAAYFFSRLQNFESTLFLPATASPVNCGGELDMGEATAGLIEARNKDMATIVGDATIGRGE